MLLSDVLLHILLLCSLFSDCLCIQEELVLQTLILELGDPAVVLSKAVEPPPEKMLVRMCIYTVYMHYLCCCQCSKNGCSKLVKR
jgi:hypothetical protein